ncbi:MAG: hypothetical protein ACJA1C_002257 [Crocinitomicaceae bacterium]|jgi:uncharacterized protein YbdZ (MbtH family)
MKIVVLFFLNIILGVNLIAQENNKIIIYEDANYGAAYFELDSNWQASDIYSIWDNKISSIRIPEGIIVIIYENTNFSGAHKVLDKDWQALEKDVSWNNKVSSIRFLDFTKPYGMIYHCYLQDGTENLWSRTSDFVLNDNSKVFFGIDQIKNPVVDTVDMSLIFTTDAGNEVNAKIIIDGNEIFGWVQQSNGPKKNLYGHMVDILPDNYRPILSQSEINNMPISTVKNEQKEILTPTRQYPTTNYTEGIRVFKTDNFKGESRYVDEDWSFGDINNDADFFDWWRKIKSIRVPKGWATTCYSGENFSGNSIQITGDWIPANDPKWNENIKSIKIVRKGIEDYWGNLLNPAVTVYKTANFSGESRSVDEDWSFGDINNDDDFFDWWRKIKSIRVPRGCAITCYSGEKFSGNSIQITGDWIPANDPKWNENIKSIKITRYGR